MASSSLSPKLTTHVSLVLLVVTISAFSAQAHQVTHTLKGYVRDPLYPRPNTSSTITKTYYITKTPNPNSDVVATWDFMLAPLAGSDLESNTNMALVSGVITPYNGFDDHENDRLQPLVIQGLLNSSSNPVANLVATSSGTQLAQGIISLTRVVGLSLSSSELLSVAGSMSSSSSLVSDYTYSHIRTQMSAWILSSCI